MCGRLAVLLWSLVFLESIWAQSVNIYSSLYGQLLTSSTLKWVPTQGNMYPSDIVNGGRAEETPLFVCRAAFHGRQIPGYLRKPLCTVELVGDVQNYTSFDVLRSVDESAYLEWRPWQRGHRTDGAVYTDGFYIVRSLTGETGDTYLGKLEVDTGNQKVTIVQGSVVAHPKTAEVLVEVMPFQYFLKDIRINSNRVYTRDRSVSLVKKSYINPSPNPKTIKDQIEYEISLVESWGDIAGTYRGTSTMIATDGSRLETDWGLELQKKVADLKYIEFELPAYSKILLSAEAVIRTQQRPYMAKLIAFFSTNEGTQIQRHRTVSGLRKEETVDDINIRKEHFQLLNVSEDNLMDPEEVQSSIRVEIKESADPVTNPMLPPPSSTYPTQVHRKEIDRETLYASHLFEDDGSEYRSDNGASYSRDRNMFSDQSLFPSRLPNSSCRSHSSILSWTYSIVVLFTWFLVS